MTIRNSERAIQGPSAQHGAKAYHVFQDIILTEKGVDCTVFVGPEFISIRTATLGDYYLAKSAIRGMTPLEIRRDEK